MRWYSNDNRAESAREKRERLVGQCKKHSIPATMGKSKEESRGRKRVKPTTIGRMRRLLREKRIEPCC